MNLYELASRVQPDSLADHQSKVIWQNGSGRFAYLIRLEDVVYLRVSGSEVQLTFYDWNGIVWERIKLEQYKEIAQLWQSGM